MKTIYNFFDDDAIDLALSEVETLKGIPGWNTNYNYWSPELVSTGCIATTPVSAKLTNIITHYLQPHVPPRTRFTLAHTLFHPNSSINYHNDGQSVYGATIYLTRNWNIDWGGLYVYGNTDRYDTQDLKVLFPTFNSIVINSGNQYHTVTTVSPLAPHPRHTIQIFGYET